MSLENLRTAFRKVPRFILLGLMIAVGLPAHIIRGAYAGICEGLSDWSYEYDTIRKLDSEPPVTEAVIRSRIRQNRIKSTE